LARIVSTTSFDDGLDFLAVQVDVAAPPALEAEIPRGASVSMLAGDADLTVSLEAGDARPVPGARVDDDEGTSPPVDVDALRRNDARKRVVYWAFERSAIDHDLGRVAEYMRRDFGHMLMVPVAALPHHVPEQDAPLRGVDHVLDRRGERGECASRGCGCGFIQLGAHAGLSCISTAALG
jgi:hypothetical protein